MNKIPPPTDGSGITLPLQNTEERYHAIFEHSTEITAVMEAVRDANGQVLDWRYRDANTNALTLLNRSYDELIGSLISEVLPDIAPRLIHMFARVLEKRVPYHYEAHFNDRDFLVS